MEIKYSSTHLDEREYIQVAKNYYALKSELKNINFDKGHIALCQCVAERRNPLVFTAQSSCALNGIERLGDYEMRPHAIAEGHKGADIIRWHFGPPEPRTKTIQGLRVSSPTRAIFDLAGHDTTESLLASINSGLYKKIFTKYELDSALEKRRGTKWSKYLERIASFSTTKSESPIETLAWIQLYKAQFIMPEQQVEIKLENSTARVDMYWKLKNKELILEVDGRGKYKSDDVLFKEKLREDELRALGYDFIRVPYYKLKAGKLQSIVAAKGVPQRRSFGRLFPE